MTVFKTAKADQISDLFDRVSFLNLALKIQTIQKKRAQVKLEGKKLMYSRILTSH